MAALQRLVSPLLLAVGGRLLGGLRARGALQGLVAFLGRRREGAGAGVHALQCAGCAAPRGLHLDLGRGLRERAVRRAVCHRAAVRWSHCRKEQQGEGKPRPGGAPYP